MYEVPPLPGVSTFVQRQLKWSQGSCQVVANSLFCNPFNDLKL